MHNLYHISELDLREKAFKYVIIVKLIILYAMEKWLPI